MSQLQSLRPAGKKDQGITDEMLREFALGVLLSNNGDQISFRARDLAECANAHAGVAVRVIESEVLGEDKIVVFTLIPKEDSPASGLSMAEPEKKSGIILLN